MIREIKRLFTLLLAFCILVNIIPGASAIQLQDSQEANSQIVKVEWPGAGKDAMPNIQKAISEAQQFDGPVTIEFEQDKEYEVYRETAYHLDGYYISNAASIRGNENPTGERFSAIFLKEMQDITIEGNNALLLVHGEMTPILIDHCTNIQLQNLHVDYAVPTVSELTILSQEGNTAVIEVNKTSNYIIENGNKLKWVSEKTMDGSSYYWAHYYELIAEYNPDDQTVWRTGTNPLANVTEIKELGDNKLQLTYSGNPHGTVGRTYQYRDGVRDQVGSFVHYSKDVSFVNMGFHYMHGLGIVGQYSENLSFDRLDCSPRKETGRTNASFADFIQISGCKGLISVTNSNFFGAHDDVMNVHGTNLRIINKNNEQQKITVQFMHHQSWGFQAFNIGDEIEFYDNSTLIPYGTNTVTDFKRLNDTQIELTLKNPLPEEILVGAHVVHNLTYTPDVVFRNNTMASIVTRAVLIQTPGDVLIEGNTFNRMMNEGVLIESDANNWFEAAPVRNVTVRNNTFNYCGGAAVNLNPQTQDRNDPKMSVHQNVAIYGNDIYGVSSINAHHVKNLQIYENTFHNTGNITVNTCDGFFIGQDNTGANVRVSNCINEQSLKELEILSGEVERSELDRTGMTVSIDDVRNGYAAENVLDNNPETFWHSDWDNPPADGRFEIVVGFQGEKTFNCLAYQPRPAGDTSGNATKYELYAKQGDSFVKIAEGNWSNSSDTKYAELNTSVTTSEIKFVILMSDRGTEPDRPVANCAELRFENVTHKNEEIPTGKRFKLNMHGVGIWGQDADLSSAEIVYTSSAPDIISVEEDGYLYAKAPGTAELTVRATLGSYSVESSVQITVSDDTYQGAESVQILTSDSAVPAQLEFNVTPESARDDIAWTIESVSGGPASITPNGVIQVNKPGRFVVTAFSQNDPTIKDTKMYTLYAVEADSSWDIVRENRNSLHLDESNALQLQLGEGMLWGGRNDASNVIYEKTEIGDQCTLIAKMTYKPTADYAEAGIGFYSNDDNYIMISRKYHSGYGGNIFEMLGENNASSPWESASSSENSIKDTIDSQEIFLKLVKAGNQYSGYFSKDGNDWHIIFENKELVLNGTLYPAILSSFAGGETQNVTYSSFSVDNEEKDFSTIFPDLKMSPSQITAVENLGLIEVTDSVSFEHLNLPDRVRVTWNGTYQDSVPVEWDQSSFNPDVAEQTVVGTLIGIPAENNTSHLQPRLVVRNSSIDVPDGGSSSSVSYTITVTQSTGGKISPSTTSVKKGSDKTFTITASEGYKISDVFVDGKSVGAVSTYTFENVTAKHTITAKFEKVEEITNVGGFTDVQSDDWFAEAVQYAVDEGLMNGTSSGKFTPNGATTRGMIVTILYRQAGSPTVESDGKTWWSDARAWAMANGISDGTNMEGKITREQLATMLYRYAELMGEDVSKTTSLASFQDGSKVSSYAVEALEWAAAEGIVTGKTGNVIDPQAGATRAETATMLMRFCKTSTK